MEVPEVADAPGSVPDPHASASARDQDAPDASGTGTPVLRRRGRTALLIAAAAVLGVVAGTCAGYVVQAGREPTALPPLSQPVLAQAKGKGPEPLSAAQDRRLRTDGDLRKLLLKRPSGARDLPYPQGRDGWMNLAEYAEDFSRPDGAFKHEISNEFRRAAVTGWRVGSTYHVEVRLVQYRQEEQLGAAESAENAHYWAGNKGGTDSLAIPGTGDGMVYVHTRPETEFGVPLYSAEAHARRGDIALEIWVYDTKPIPKEKIMDLAKRQVGRL
ncbi:hypothetical protein ACFOZ0_07980 [Streptomyces yaanensis]|uniref:Uncharacterized protein n=1 Tax=Streptomyces yaanensis TaxID=1142239 RepID=A0ABV7S9K0_9ACTN|nr:hypothetical protein [Streptomyces sp. CGMCC 4.7035]WNC02717.1 hypothetical protein Q2K21_34250 [Streptomyces sp. CGMCC 4.7035]